MKKLTKPIHKTPKPIQTERVDFIKHLPKTAENIATATDEDFRMWVMGTIFDLIDKDNDILNRFLEQVYVDIAKNTDRLDKLEEWSPKDEWSVDIESDVARLKDTVAKLEKLNASVSDRCLILERDMEGYHEGCPINKEGCAGRCPHSEKGETKYSCCWEKGADCPNHGEPKECEHEWEKAGFTTNSHMENGKVIKDEGYDDYLCVNCNESKQIQTFPIAPKEPTHVEPLRMDIWRETLSELVKDIQKKQAEIIAHVEELCKKVEKLNNLKQRMLELVDATEEMVTEHEERISELEK